MAWVCHADTVTVRVLDTGREQTECDTVSSQMTITHLRVASESHLAGNQKQSIYIRNNNAVQVTPEASCYQ